MERTGTKENDIKTGVERTGGKKDDVQNKKIEN